jgi:hypothetical protein
VPKVVREGETQPEPESRMYVLQLRHTIRQRSAGMALAAPCVEALLAYNSDNGAKDAEVTVGVVGDREGVRPLHPELVLPLMVSSILELTASPDNV